MKPPSTPTRITASAGLSNTGETRLQGYWLVLARIVWIALLMLGVSVSGISLLKYLTLLKTTCIPVYYYSCIPEQLSPESAHTLQHLGFTVSDYAGLVFALSTVIATVWFVVGLVIFWRKSDDWMALLVSSLLIIHTGDFSQSYSSLQLLNVLAQFFAELTIFLVCFLFPSGRFVPHWLRWPAIVGLVWILDPYIFPDSSPFSPYYWPFPFYSLLLFTLLGACVFSQIYRYKRTSSFVQRQQTKWVVYAFSATLLGLISEALVFEGPLSNVLPTLFHQLAYILFWIIIPVIIPLSFGIAILRYHLWDIDRVINRTLVYGVLTASIVSLYVLVVVGLGALLQAEGNLAISLLATGLVAVLFQPLRSRLQRTVNHLMYGDRDDPYRVISRLGQRLEATLAPEAVLPTIVETVAQALRLPYAAMALKQDGAFVMMASYGTVRSEVIRLPLVYQTEQVGELVLAPRAPGESFTPADRALLSDLARQAGIAAHAVHLTADLKRLTVDLQRSREHLVTAREEERRRLRRDLHDGLGPQLASLTLKLETARNLLAHDPLAQTLLSDLAQRTQATVVDIRRLVYALRPPALDELGLISALRELTLQYGDQVSLHLDAPVCLPELPAAVEVAVYRIAQEALTNVVRHAHARRCDLRLALDEPAGWLSLSIQDDGCGLLPSRPVGVGMTSMRERAEELGGTWSMEQVPTGGTRVLARLPCTPLEPADTLVVTTSRVPEEEE